MALVLATEPRDGHAVVRAEGELDTLTRKQFDEHLANVFHEHGPNVVLDLTEVTFMDSRALGVIIHYWKLATTENGRLALAGVQYRYAKVLWITGLIDRLPVYDDVDAALAAH